MNKLDFSPLDLKKKLANWVLNAHLPAVLGISEEKKDEIREAFEALSTKGVLLRDGNRRGLKFKYNPNYVIDEVVSDAVTEEVAESEDEIKTEMDIRAYVKERDNYKVSVPSELDMDELIQWLLNSRPDKDSSIISTTISLKKLSDGSITLKAYAGIIPLVEREFNSVETFNKAMRKAAKNRSHNQDGK